MDPGLAQARHQRLVPGGVYRSAPVPLNIPSHTTPRTVPALDDSNVSAQMAASFSHARTPSMGQGSGGLGGHRNAVKMAKLFLQTCPGDWNASFNVALGGRLRTFIEDDPDAMSDSEVFSIIRFRWEYGLLIDSLIPRLGLPAPSNVMCMLWDRQEWKNDIKRRISDADGRLGIVWHALVESDFYMAPDPELKQGPHFYRPMQYIAAAIVEADLNKDMSMKKVAEATQLINDAKKFYADIIIKESTAIQH